MQFGLCVYAKWCWWILSVSLFLSDYRRWLHDLLGQVHQGRQKVWLRVWRSDWYPHIRHTNRRSMELFPLNSWAFVQNFKANRKVFNARQWLQSARLVGHVRRAIGQIGTKGEIYASKCICTFVHGRLGLLSNHIRWRLIVDLIVVETMKSIEF